MNKNTAAQKMRHSKTTDQRMASLVFHEGRLVMAPSFSNDIRLNISCELPSPVDLTDISLATTDQEVRMYRGRHCSRHSPTCSPKPAIPESWLQRTPYLRSCEFSANRGNFATVGGRNPWRAAVLEPVPSSDPRRFLPVVVQ